MKYARNFLALAALCTALASTAPAFAQGSVVTNAFTGTTTMVGPSGPGAASGTAGNTGTVSVGTTGSIQVDPVELAARAQANYGGSGSAQFGGDVSGTLMGFPYYGPPAQDSLLTGIANRQPLLAPVVVQTAGVQTFSQVLASPMHVWF